MQYGTTSPFDPCVWFSADPHSESLSLARSSAQLQRVTDRGPQPSVEIATRLLQLLRVPEFSMAQVADLVEADPALTARVLRAANSPMFSARQPCKTVQHAVAMLGARTIGELAAAAAVSDLFGRSGVEASLRSHAVATAALARELARLLGRPGQDLFLAGLLHDLGKLILLQGAGGERYGLSSQPYDELLNVRVGIPGGTHLLEQTALGFDHGAVGQAALQAWGIPDPIPALVGSHHDVERASREGDRFAESVCLLRLADSMAHTFAGPRFENEATRLQLREPAAMTSLGLEPHDVEHHIPHLQLVHASAAELLD